MKTAEGSAVTRTTGRQVSAGRRHLPGLDGLRAIAVVGVLLYHAGVGWIPGGFLGVDLFFVISGFLITTLLLAESDLTGRISLRHFYLRRARRLLPALAAMLVVVVLFMAVFFRGDLGQAHGDVAAAASYVSNWWYVLHHRSYFVAAGRPSPLQHLWSLAVEEQFYLVWPVMVVALVATRARLRWITVVAIAGALGSAFWMRALAIRGNVPFDTDSSRLYYGTDTHASALLLGAAAAAVMAGLAGRRVVSLPAIARHLIDVAALAGLLALGWSMYAVGYYTPSLYRGGFLEFAAIAAVVVAIVSVPDGWLGRALDVARMHWIGERSYGLYLWHWPVFCLHQARARLAVAWIGCPRRPACDCCAADRAELPVRRGSVAAAWCCIEGSCEKTVPAIVAGRGAGAWRGARCRGCHRCDHSSSRRASVSPADQVRDTLPPRRDVQAARKPTVLSVMAALSALLVLATLLVLRARRSVHFGRLRRPPVRRPVRGTRLQHR